MKLCFDGLRVGYKKKQVLEDVSFQVPAGQITALIGRNGVGKSTVLRCLAGDKSYWGTITLDGVDAATMDHNQRAKQVAYLPQDLPRPRVTVEELVAFGRAPYTPLTGKLSALDAEKIEKALADVEITHLRNTFVDTLSGGERKKAFFAMVLAQDTPVVLLDEPTAHLDAVSRFRFLELVERICREQGKTFLIVMHDLSDVLRFADRVVVLHQKQMVFDGTPEEALDQRIPQAYFGIALTGNRETGFAATPVKE
jgi:iron complex transport system ATP-binding protein